MVDLLSKFELLQEIMGNNKWDFFLKLKFKDNMSITQNNLIGMCVYFK